MFGPYAALRRLAIGSDIKIGVQLAERLLGHLRFELRTKGL